MSSHYGGAGRLRRSAVWLRSLVVGMYTGARQRRELAGHEDPDHPDQAGRHDETGEPRLPDHGEDYDCDEDQDQRGESVCLTARGEVTPTAGAIVPDRLPGCRVPVRGGAGAARAVPSAGPGFLRHAPIYCPRGTLVGESRR